MMNCTTDARLRARSGKRYLRYKRYQNCLWNQ